MNYWETIAQRLTRSGWSWGFVTVVGRKGRTMYCADAHCGDGRRFVVHADEMLTAFLELEAQCRAASKSAL